MKNFLAMVALFIATFVCLAVFRHIPVWIIPALACGYFYWRDAQKIQILRQNRADQLAAIEGELSSRLVLVIKASTTCLHGVSLDEKAALFEHIETAIKHLGQPDQGLRLKAWRYDGLSSLQAAAAIVDRYVGEKMEAARKALAGFENEYAMAYRLSDGMDGTYESERNLTAAYISLQKTREAFGRRDPDLASALSAEGVEQARASSRVMLAFCQR